MISENYIKDKMISENYIKDKMKRIENVKIIF